MVLSEVRHTCASPPCCVASKWSVSTQIVLPSVSICARPENLRSVCRRNGRITIRRRTTPFVNIIPVSHTLCLISFPCGVCKLTDGFGIECSVNFLPSRLKTSCGLPIICLGVVWKERIPGPVRNRITVFLLTASPGSQRVDVYIVQHSEV
jgi:hypothetical protein